MTAIETASPDRELQALVSLLASEDDRAVAVLTEQMRSFPRMRLQRLLELADAYPAARAPIELVLSEGEAIRTEAELRRWRQTGADLEAGMELVVRMRYPSVAPGTLGGRLDALADTIEARLPTADSVKRLRSLVYLLHQVHGFHGNEEDYYHPDNSFLNRVLDLRTGNPLTLSVLYALLGRRLSLDMGVIGLPGHVIISMPGMPSAIYIDPYHSGRSLNPGDITRLVNSAGYVFHPEQLRRASTVQIMQRTLANLEGAFERTGDLERAALIGQFRQAL
jgi:regulator of sirC expression with transglutaminase-like and TPR domain